MALFAFSGPPGLKSTPIPPNDEFLSEQWNPQSQDPFINKDGKGKVQGSDHAHVGEAWQLILDHKGLREIDSVGSNVRMAIIDDGIDLEHEDLKGSICSHQKFWR